jgi:type II restriction/modification system DNA methylase subunit YeeA
MNKTAIKSFAIEARKKLISEITYRAGLVGITKGAISDPIHKASGIEMYDIGGNEPYAIKGEEIAQRNSLASKVRVNGFENVIEEVAYTWFNRIIAIRFMEVNDYLPTRVRVLSSENKDKIEPDIVTEAPNVDLEFTSTEIDEILQLKQDNKLDELFRLLFIKQCNALNDILPELFEKTSDYTELLLSISFTNEDSIVRELVRSIEEEDFREQVEIIGWLYQYYNTELKDETFALLKKNVKITKARIPAATQLFTPDWIVRYMVENSLGRLWIEGHPDSNIKDNWKYYLEEAEQEEDVKIQLNKIREERKNVKPEEIKFIDPSMGSGHILVYAFDVFMEIYKSYGYGEREAAKLILKNNLYGLDIDDRAYQLAYFAVMMKARGYARRILNEGIKPNLCSIQESNDISRELLEFVTDGNEDILNDLIYISDRFKDSKEYGSILNIEKLNFERLHQKIKEKLNSESDNLFSIVHKQEVINKLIPLVNQAEIMALKYDTVVTNPPYMGSGGMSEKLSVFIKKNYPETKSDMSTVFMEKTLNMCKPTGNMAMINIPVWMFLASYEKLRNNLILSNSFINMLHLGRGVFGSDFGTVAFVMSRSNISKYTATYRKLYLKQGAVDSIEQKEKWFFGGLGNFVAQQENYFKIPGKPIAYWLSKEMFETFNYRCVGDYLITREGMATADNARFLRFWSEVNFKNIGFNYNTIDDTIDSGLKWFPYNKGGEFRRWYGNNDYIVNWKNDGFEVRNNKDEKTGRIRSHNYNGNYALKSGITWTSLSISSISLRFSDEGFLFDSKGAMGFCEDKKILRYILALLNGRVGAEYLKVFSPTVDFKVGDIIQVPIIIENLEYVDEIVHKNISIAKCDWDSFETSWDFKKHPLVKRERNTIESSFEWWEKFTEEQFYKLKANEEELNDTFIKKYGLQNEITPEVEDKDVTIRKADLVRDIKSFISYSIGCMFGRYSLDNDGLVYAGGEWDASKYKTFIPDEDNIIPITDDEYFTDDIVGRFIEFVKVTYGEDTLEENLDFIAKALGNKGDTSRQIIRNYFIKDFYKDHVKIYQKKPIYWMFDSGKENGFKALIYMHRYNEDTVALVRADYLHKVQKAIENAIESADIIIDSATSPAQKAKAVKQKEKLVKQLAETRNYDAAIAHVASKRIGIDLDDGVTVNYAKFQGVEVSREGKKAVKIDLLSKI